ncbi:MAG TPA: sulfotransferase domain-containing protein [Tepidisphaeraceae bacterium]|jgi:hypothetical protein|nr:sulfotransferase domain-containing protein [Tepidisphaeraceae bacterium]
MLYLISGMNRSGSTWLFNAVRLLLARHDSPDLGSGWIAERNTLLQHRTTLIKVHEYDASLLSERWPCAVLVSHRDPRDVVASMSRKFQLEPSVNLARYIVDQYRLWSRHAIYDMSYETMITEPLAELQRVATLLGLPTTHCSEILAELDELRRSITTTQPAGVDSTTLLHPGHITDGRPNSWQDQIPPALAADIEQDLHPWMISHGYLPAAS